MLRRCRSQAKERFSPVCSWIRWASILKKAQLGVTDATQSFNSYRFEDVTGGNMIIMLSFDGFLGCSNRGAPLDRCDAARRWRHVKSHAKERPLGRGSIVTPSGRRPSFLMRLVSSNVDGMQALFRDSLMTSLPIWWRVNLEFIDLHIRAWEPCSSALVPHTHACAKETSTETEGTAYPKLIIGEGETQARRREGV